MNKYYCRVFIFAAICAGRIAVASPCRSRSPAEQSVWKAFVAYSKSQSEAEMLSYLRAVVQFQRDNASTDHFQDVDLFESHGSQACAKTETRLLEARALSGNRLAITIVLFYSALYLPDGAGAQTLSDLQVRLCRQQGASIQSIQHEHERFFELHPVRWLKSTP